MHPVPILPELVRGADEAISGYGCHTSQFPSPVSEIYDSLHGLLGIKKDLTIRSGWALSLILARPSPFPYQSFPLFAEMNTAPAEPVSPKGRGVGSKVRIGVCIGECWLVPD